MWDARPVGVGAALPVWMDITGDGQFLHRIPKRTHHDRDSVHRPAATAALVGFRGASWAFRLVPAAADLEYAGGTSSTSTHRRARLRRRPPARRPTTTRQ